MERRQFIGAAGALLAAGPAQAQKELQAGGTGSTAYTADVSIERKLPGKPHRGKVLAAIQPLFTDTVTAYRFVALLLTAGSLLLLAGKAYPRLADRLGRTARSRRRRGRRSDTRAR